MSDFTGFEWDKCIVYGPSTQTKDICDAFDINYNNKVFSIFLRSMKKVCILLHSKFFETLADF